MSTSSDADGSPDEEHASAPASSATVNRRAVVQTSALGLAALAGCIGGESASPGTGSSPPGTDSPPQGTENSPPDEPTETRSGKHLFILTGQSNMVGIDPSESFTPTVADEFGEDTVIVVKRARGAQSIAKWDHQYWGGDNPAVAGSIYEKLMDDVEKATNGEQLKTITVVWMQGERDANDGTGDVYAESLRRVMDQFRSDLGRDDINFVIGRISDYDMDNSHHEDWTEVRKALVTVAESEPNADWVNTDDLNGDPGGSLHYSEPGYKTLGKRFATKAIELVTNGSA